MKKLVQVATILSGIAPKGKGVAHFVRIQDLTRRRGDLPTGKHPTAKRAVPIEAGDVLVAARGEGDLAFRPDDDLIGAFAGLDLYLLRPDPERLDPDYFASVLNSESIKREIRVSAVGATPLRIPKDALAELPIPLPKLERQSVIGQFAICIERYEALARRKLAAEKRWAEACLEQAFTQS